MWKPFTPHTVTKSLNFPPFSGVLDPAQLIMSQPLRRLAALLSVSLLAAGPPPAKEAPAAATTSEAVKTPDATGSTAVPSASTPELTLQECISRALRRNF